MSGYTFKVFFANGQEHFIYEKDNGRLNRETRKDFPFPESLLDLLYLDTEELQELCTTANRSLLSYYNSRRLEDLMTVEHAVESISQKHIYFKITELEWEARFHHERTEDYEGSVQDMLPRKRIAHIAPNVKEIQGQIKRLFHDVLDIDGLKYPIQRKMHLHYEENRLRPFEFHTLPLNFEEVGVDTFTEVLYPRDVYDLIEYSLRECIKQEQRMRICKNCGKWFAITGRSTAEYCDRVIDTKGRTCKDVGSIIQWNRKRSDDEIFKAYRREYKKRFAWIKAGRVTQEEFYAWSERARREKQRCDDGKITLEEFTEWLANS